MNTPINQHKRMGQFLKNTLAMAHQKGLQVKRNQFQVGWTIVMGNGSIHSAPNNADMVAFVRGY